jgi:purine-binding chemotaxis protein CheW
MEDNNRQDIYRRLDEARSKLEQRMTLTSENRQQVLKKRAQQLAGAEVRKQDKELPLEMVEFRLADETYALECTYISEVYPLRSLTPIPGTPGFVLGIINIRGQTVSVIDLKKFFELPPKGLSDLTRVIVLKNDSMEFGILAEEVMGTTAISPGEVQPPLPTLTGIRSDYLKGITKNRLIVLDALKLLSDEKIIVNQEIEA